MAVISGQYCGELAIYLSRNRPDLFTSITEPMHLELERGEFYYPAMVRPAARQELKLYLGAADLRSTEK